MVPKRASAIARDTLASVTGSDEPFFVGRVQSAGIDPPSSLGSASLLEVRGQHTCKRDHDGIFAGWTWNGRSLTATNDRYGMYPLFYYEAGPEFGISTSLARLVEQGAPVELDASALAVFFRLGFFLGEDTPFRHIKQLPPGATLEWSGRLELREKPRSVDPAPEASRRERIRIYIELFQAAVRRRVVPGERVAVPLSGGRDSRHILLELCRIGHKPDFALTAEPYPPKRPESAFAARLAEAARVEHVILGQARRFPLELRKNLATHFCSDEHTSLVPLAGYLESRVDAIHDGIAGDVLSAGLFSSPERIDCFRQGRFERLASSLLRRTHQSLEMVFAPELDPAAGYDLAFPRVVKELEKHAAAPNPVASFFFWNRTRREIALMPFGIMRGLERCHAPYLDHDLFDFLFSLPAEFTVDKTFHTETIATAFPEFAAIPYGSSKRRSPHLHHATLLRELVRYAAAKRPDWWRANRRRVLAGWVPWFVRSTRRSWLHPTQLLYALQLQTLRETRDPVATLLPGS